MIKHRDLIEKLSLDEKLSIIADANKLSNGSLAASGVPALKLRGWEEINSKSGGFFPPFASLANSWNPRLFAQAAQEICNCAKNSGVNVVVTPEMRLVSNPYVYGVSEDPYFVRTCAYTLLKTVKGEGLTPCLAGCRMDNTQIKFLDAQPDMRTVREYFFAPFEAVSGFADGVAVTTSYTRLSGGYESINTSVLSKFVREAMGGKGFVIADRVDKNLAAASVTAGNCLTLCGDVQPLRQAVANYDSIKNSIMRSEATQTELDAACGEGNALGINAVDEAVDGVLHFALSVKPASEVAAVDNSALYVTAAEESAVLLKNTDKALPLRRGAKVAVVGAPAEGFEEYLKMRPEIVFAGSAEGYKANGERSDELVDKACFAAKDADAVLLFLRPDGRRIAAGRTKLPASQLALVDALTKINPNVIAIIKSGLAADMSFDYKLKAVLSAPFEGRGANAALVNILTGKTNPSGKLTCSLYDDTDFRFAKIKNDRETGALKVGGFIGYRAYDIAGGGVKYPFGHGLSYTAFTYSDLKISPSYIEIAVRNSGFVDGSEIVQLYIGKGDSAILRPLKELKGYTKVFLKAGEQKILRFKISAGFLSVYDEKTNKNVIEDGAYNIYIGSSVLDIRARGKMTVAGARLEPDGRRLSDYIQLQTNVVKEGYTLSPVKKAAGSGKTAVKVGTICSVLSFLCLVAILTFQLTGVIALRENGFAVAMLVIFAVVFCVFAVVLGFGIKLRAAASAAAVPIKDYRPLPREIQPELPFEELFEEYFCVDEEQPEVGEVRSEAPAAVETVLDDDLEAIKYYDSSLSLKSACSQIATYAAERGISVDAQGVARLVSAMCASRLIVLKSKQTQLIPKFVEILGGYFGGECRADDLSGVEDLSEAEIPNTERIAEEARSQRPVAHIGAIVGVSGGALKDLLEPYSTCLSRYGIASEAVLRGGRSFTVTPNFWLFIALKEGEKFKTADFSIADVATVVEIRFDITAEIAEKTEVDFLSAYQINKIASQITLLDEEKCLKKIDKFEGVVKTLAPYAIGNKEWQKLERFASAYLSCGGEQTETLDCTLACALLPSVLARLEKTDELIPALEKIFGEDNVPESKNIIRSECL